MSTYVYLTCLDHKPALKADEESGQHLYDLPQIRADILNRRALIAAYEVDYAGPEDYFRRNTVRFLAQHQICRVGIVDEYGREYPVVDSTLIADAVGDADQYARSADA